MSIQVGPHLLQVEGDTIFSKSIGSFTTEHFEQYFALAEEVIAAHGTFYAVADITLLDSIGPDARRYAAHWAKSHSIGGAALFGGRIPVRVIVLMLTKVMDLFGGLKFPLVFVASEQEAMTWLGSRRKESEALKERSSA